MSDSGSSLIYQRILLKLSGEALMGKQDFGIDSKVIEHIVHEIEEVIAVGVQVGLVIGGGNIFRGVSLASKGMDRSAADHAGMLATVINALVVQDALERHGIVVRVMSALSIHVVCEDYIRRRAIRHLEKGRVVIFAAGTGNPFFTTDSAATLRGIEIGADLVLKATKVDGVYSSDPVKSPDADLFTSLTYDEVLERRLAVMDQAAIILCREHSLPLRVFNMSKSGALMKIVCGGDEGTLIEAGDAA